MANGREEVMAATLASLQLVYICIICNNIGIASLKLLYRIHSYRKLELLNAIAFCWCVGGVITRLHLAFGNALKIYVLYY